MNEGKMKAVVYEKYGSPEVLKIKEIAKPSPKDNEVLVKIHCTTVTAGDIRMRKFDVPRSQWLIARIFLGFFKPKKAVLGMEISGEIINAGKNVTKFKKGDRVFASTLSTKLGGYSEYKCFPEDEIISVMPEEMKYEQAATLPVGGATAVRFLRKGKIKSGQKVLINGASGSVGTFAVQIAKHYGAEVTGVCSTTNIALVKSIGADYVIDYKKEDFTRNGKKYDLIIDAVDKADKSKCKSILNDNGMFLSLTGNAGKENVEDLEFLKKLIENGELKPVIDKIYSLTEIVKAHTYVQKGHKKGNVVIKII